MLREVLTVSALILAVLLVRAIFKNRVPKRMVYALWLVVLVKLCLPGTLVSLPILPAEETAAPVQRVELPAQTAPVVLQPAQAVVQPQVSAQQPVSPAQEAAEPAAKPLTTIQILQIVWAVGSALLGLWLLAGFYDSPAQESAFPRQAGQNAHLCFQRGQIAVPCRSDSGGISDGGRTANGRGGAYFEP